MSQDNKNNNQTDDETATTTMAEKTTDIFTSREQEIMLNALLCMKEAPAVSFFPLFCLFWGISGVRGHDGEG